MRYGEDDPHNRAFAVEPEEPCPVVVQFLLTVWLRQWAGDLEALRTREADGSTRQSFYAGMVAALEETAARVQEGNFEPGGEIYERISNERLTEP